MYTLLLPHIHTCIKFLSGADVLMQERSGIKFYRTLASMSVYIHINISCDHTKDIRRIVTRVEGVRKTFFSIS